MFNVLEQREQSSLAFAIFAVLTHLTIKILKNKSNNFNIDYNKCLTVGFTFYLLF